MIGSVIVDTGPLVAYLDRRDAHFAWSKAEFDQIRPPLLTCEAVLTEAFHLVRKVHGGGQALLDLLDRGLIAVPLDLEAEVVAVRGLIGRYADVPMSLADACLVRMAELATGSLVLTLDRDFLIYRRLGKDPIPTRLPGA